MICDQPDGHIFLLVFLISSASYSTHSVSYRLHCIDIKNRVHILNHNCKAFQSHASINIFLRKFLIMSLAVAVKLRKNVIPNLNKAVTVTANLAIWFATTVFDTSIIIDFRTGTARSSTMLPEIITRSSFWVPIKACDLFRRYTNLIDPDMISFLIFAVDRRIKSLWVQSDHFGQKLPAPVQCLMFKIISK